MHHLGQTIVLCATTYCETQNVLSCPDVLKLPGPAAHSLKRWAKHPVVSLTSSLL